ncbi:NACHT domain-containing NTPase [Pedobacter sp. MC2016-24]|uniref:NACHT domain-containing protein n=1 Tax=Pedobacter sp. MC2016-24 TaxID=2780090 RepID=UPI0018815C89|nr:NACHT domain-containing protein [Pedobacter sp. MC2016-24]MBE9601480.1 NACHT domain-containing protein [Pedobacter sp. MC2016-24]
MAKASSILPEDSNKFIETLAEEGGKSLFQLTWSLITKYGKKAVDRTKAIAALERYAENYTRRHGEIKVLNMSSPIPLKEIYTKVRLVHTHKEYFDENIEDLERAFRERKERYRNSLDVSTVINEHQRLNVLGGPGAGKSTLLKRVGLYLLAEDQSNEFQLDNQHIPVLIELKQFKVGNPVDIAKAIQNEFEIAGFPESEDFLKDALGEGKLLILLDGLDEVPKALLDEAISAIKNFVDRYPTNRYITSCRTAYYKNYLIGFNDIEVSSFDDRQIRAFVSNWFNAERDAHSSTSDRLCELLFDTAHKATLELARTPLLLTFLCIVFDAGQQFPANRSSLYRRALEILLERWSAEKRIHQEEIYQNLNTDIETKMLAEIAAYFYEKDKTLFHTEELKSRISVFLENTLGVKLPHVSAILDAIEVQQGLLVQRTLDVYSFSHLTIQEYLVAFHYCSPLLMPKLIAKHCFDKKWREVFILQAGMYHSEDILLLMSRHLKEFASKHPILSDAISWVNQSVKSSNTPEGAGIRLLLLSFLIRYRRKEVAISYGQNAIGDKVERINNALVPDYLEVFPLFPKHSGKQSAPLIIDSLVKLTGKSTKKSALLKEVNEIKPEKSWDNMMPGMKLSFNKRILDTIFKSFGVPEHFVKPNSKSFGSVENYIEGIALLMDCRAAALRISPPVWSEIISNIVR